MTASDDTKPKEQLEAELTQARAQIAELNRSVQSYRGLVENARDMIWRTDLQGRVIYVNAYVQDFLGRTPSEALGLSIDDYFSPSSAARIVHGVQQTLLASSESSFEAEVEYRHKNGTLIPGELRMFAERDPSGRIVAFGGISRETSERRRAERALRDSSELLTMFIDRSPIHAYIKDVTPTQSIVLYASDKFREMIGIPGCEMVGRTMEALFPPEFAAKITADDWAVVEGGGVLQLDEQLNGRSYTTIKFPIPLGSRSFLAGYTIDITDRKEAEEALRESESRSNQLAEHSRTVAWEVDAEGLYTYLSHVAESVFGYRPEEVLGRLHFYDLHPEPGRAAFKNAALAVFRQKERFRDLINPIQTKDGALVWVSTNGIPLLNADGSLRGYRGSDTDVTERKRAEEALRASEGVLRAFIDSHADMVYLKNAELRHIVANPALCQYFGREEADVLGRCDSELMPPSAAERCRTGDEDALRTRTLQVHEEMVGDRVFETRKFPVVLVDGSVGVGGIIRDVTERKRADETLRASEARLIHAQALSRIGNWEIDLATNTIWASAEAFRIYGVEYTSPFQTLKRAQDIPIREDRGRLDEALRALIHNGVPYDVEFRLKRADDGTQRVVHSVAHLVRDAEGSPIKVVGVMQDITERRQAEEEKARLEAQLQQAQKMESVGRLAGGVAHDFNNMLGVILGNVMIAIEQVDPTEPLHGDLLEIQAAAKRSAELTRQLLAFARKQTVAPRVLDLNETVAGTLKMLQRLIGERIELHWQPDPSLWPVRVDPSQVDQILANLCVNARDAISDVGRMTIETGNCTFDDEDCSARPGFLPGQYVRLAVSDNGSGMDKETLEHLFEPFFTTKVLGKGTGLGLATVYGIVKQNNGFIDAASEPDKGTTFSIYLPRHLGRDRRAGSDQPGSSTRQGSETILVVEDEPAILKLTTRMLQRQGYTVLPASTPSEAIRLAAERNGEIHLLLSDVVMPEMNGRDLAQQLLARYPSIKRLFMSGYTADVIAHHGVLDDGVFFIEKPFSEHALAAKVRETLDRN
ncbi:MAG: PAS domain S-box protein [Deltaproteobacteria bacterium]|nr:PAS domain S-box protein [Deltaproteobacteria bacterium]